jgi:hypothetical protein
MPPITGPSQKVQFVMAIFMSPDQNHPDQNDGIGPFESARM